MIGDPLSKHLKQMAYCLKSMLSLVISGKCFIAAHLLTSGLPCDEHFPFSSVPCIEFGYWAEKGFIFNVVFLLLGHGIKQQPSYSCTASHSFRKRAITLQKIFTNECHLRVYNG